MESFDETISIREERSAPSSLFQSMKIYTGFVLEGKSNVDISYSVREWSSQDRVSVPEKKKEYIYWRDPSGVCSSEGLLASPTVSLQGRIHVWVDKYPLRTWRAMSQVKVMCKLIMLSKQRYQSMIYAHLI